MEEMARAPCILGVVISELPSDILSYFRTFSGDLPLTHADDACSE